MIHPFSLPRICLFTFSGLAMSWATSNQLGKLRSAIAEAESVGADPNEVIKAREILDRLSTVTAVSTVTAEPPIPVEAADADRIFRDFFHSCRRDWTAKDVDAVTTKLSKIGVVDMDGFGRALRAEGESSINSLLKTAGFKGFSRETLENFVHGLVRTETRTET